MDIVLTGSIAYDYLMTFPGVFREHILPDRLDSISLSFLVDSMIRRRGGIAANIAYTLALLGEKPTVMSTVGEDFDDYRSWLDQNGINTSAIRSIPGMSTASFFVTTDRNNAQIASFYTGAMARSTELHFTDLAEKPRLAVISPNDPAAMAQFVRECGELSIPYLYDPSQQVVRLTAEEVKEGIGGANALFVNDYEFGLIQAKTGWDIDELTTKTDFIVVTRGDEGADLYTEGICMHIPVIAPEAIADPTGVGDAFRGGFLKGYLHHVSLERCGQMGALAATYCLENHGTQGHRFDLPTFVERFRQHFDDRGELDRLT